MHSVPEKSRNGNSWGNAITAVMSTVPSVRCYSYPERCSNDLSNFFVVVRTHSLTGQPLQEMMKIRQENWDVKPTETLVNDLRGCNNLLRQTRILSLLSQRHGLDFDTGIGKNGMRVCCFVFISLWFMWGRNA